MIKKTIILSLLGSTLLLTGCSNTHQIDDIPNHNTNNLKKATVIYPYSGHRVLKNVELHHYHGSHYRERDHVIGFSSDTH